MNVALQFSIADEYFRAGYYPLRKEDLSPEEREQALENLEIAKETFQLCLDSESPDLNYRLRMDIHNRLLKIRELLVGELVKGLEFDEEREE